MANSRCLSSGGIIGVRHGANRESILVTVDGDGVSVYDANTQVTVQSWALGGAGASFTAPAVYAKPLKRFFASLNEPKGGGMVIRGWSSETVDSNPTATPTIQQSSTSIQLPLAAPPIFLHPLPKMDDGSDVSDHTPCLLLAHQDGAITLCNSVSVVSQDLSLQGYPLLTAKGVGNSLYTIHKDRKSSNAVLMQKLSVSPSGVITRLSLDALSPPGENVPALAAIVIVPRNVATTPSAVVLWSDFSISGYVPWSIHAGLGLDAISDAEPNVLETTEALFVRRLKGFLAAGQTKKSSSGGKSGGATPRRKRGHQQSQENSNFTNVGLVSAGDGVVLVAGWSIDNKDSKDSIDSLRLVSLDAMYGALLSAENIPFPSQNVDKGRPIQVRLYKLSILVWKKKKKGKRSISARALRSPSPPVEAA